jgi:hypothetical protein
MGAGRQVTNPNDLHRDYAVKTLLPGAKYYALTAATDFLQQFIIAEFFRNLRFGRFWFIVRLDIRIHAATRVKGVLQSYACVAATSNAGLGKPRR